MYAASIMFGYFIRRVDKRFQLERQLGLLDDQQADAVARLERMFNAASEGEQDPDRPATPSESASPSTSTSDDSGATSSSTSGAGTRGEGADLGKGKKKDSLLRKYIESFDQQTLADMTRQVASFSGHMPTLLYISTSDQVAAADTPWVDGLHAISSCCSNHCMLHALPNCHLAGTA